MSKKAFSTYSAATELGGLNHHQLIIELSKHHISCVVVNEQLQVIGFELFKLDEDELDFDDLLVEVMRSSKLLDKSYTETKVYTNSPYAVLIPSEHFNKQIAEDYLSIGFGEAYRQVMRYDQWNDTSGITIAFRLDEEVPEQMNRRLIMVEFHHVFAKMAEHLLKQEQMQQDKIKVQFYYKHIIVGVMKDGKLQLIQYFNYNSSEDVLYYLLNICQQLGLNTAQVMLEISGMIDLQSALYNELNRYFGNIGLEEINPSNLPQDFQQYPPHYLSPFFNLAV
jgi:hypothetical protein